MKFFEMFTVSAVIFVESVAGSAGRSCALAADSEQILNNEIIISFLMGSPDYFAQNKFITLKVTDKFPIRNSF